MANGSTGGPAADRGLLLPGTDALEDRDFLRFVADRGYDRLWAGELWGTDAFVRLTRAAEAAGEAGRTPGLGTAIVNTHARTPAALAGAAASLAELSDGPFRLGLGPSTATVVEDLHGGSYDRPVRRLHEAAELVRAFVGDGVVDYEGEVFAASGFPGLDADVEVYAAALGPAARRATGRVADGWLPHNVPFPDLADAFETVARTAREAGRDPAAITVAPYVPTAVCEAEADARALLRGHVAYYVGNGEGYRRAVAERFPAADDVAAAWRAGDREAARDAVTDAMVDALGVAATPATAAARFREVAALPVVDEPIVVVPSRASPATVRRTVRAVAPAER